ncbi:MAG: zf-HC2 domain-containing protein, partial [Candidatus Dormibacteria bacterium]
MTTHEQVDELIAAFALGAVEDAEATLVRRHLPECPECQDTLVRMTEVVAVLPLSLEEVAPPEDLKSRVLARVSGTAVSIPAGAADAEVQGLQPGEGKLLFLRRVPAWAPVAAAAALLAVMF